MNPTSLTSVAPGPPAHSSWIDPSDRRQERGLFADALCPNPKARGSVLKDLLSNLPWGWGTEVSGRLRLEVLFPGASQSHPWVLETKNPSGSGWSASVSWGDSPLT